MWHNNCVPPMFYAMQEMADISMAYVNQKLSANTQTT